MVATRPLILVTRPEPQATQWAQALSQAGVPAQALPLMATQAPVRVDAVHRLWLKLADDAKPAPPAAPWRALMFVSPAAVHWFFAHRPLVDGQLAMRTWPARTLLAAPGLGTAQALQEALANAGLHPGIAPVLHPPADAAQFDSEHLWPVLAPIDWAGQNVAIIGGGDGEQARGRQWLSQRWQAAGASVHTVQAYQRGPSVWTPTQQALAHSAWLHPADHLWLASSSDALSLLHTHHLPALWPAQATSGVVNATAAHRLLATHPRIAETAATHGWQAITTCPPTLSAVAAASAELRSAC